MVRVQAIWSQVFPRVWRIDDQWGNPERSSNQGKYTFQLLSRTPWMWIENDSELWSISKWMWKEEEADLILLTSSQWPIKQLMSTWTHVMTFSNQFTFIAQEEKNGQRKIPRWKTWSGTPKKKGVVVAAEEDPVDDIWLVYTYSSNLPSCLDIVPVSKSAHEARRHFKSFAKRSRIRDSVASEVTIQLLG